MKKQLITLLMAGLLVVGFGGSALADDVSGDDNTTTSKTVVTGVTQKEPAAWTVTIPTALTAGTDITIKPTLMKLPVGAKVEVKADKATVALSRKGDADSKINVDLKDNSDAVITADTAFVTFTESAVVGTDNFSLKTVAAANVLKAGLYEGTVTFTATYVPGPND